jgi:hypothetical protein
MTMASSSGEASGRVIRARCAVDAANDELLAALGEELARHVGALYPAAAWLIVDPSRWRDDSGEFNVALTAVVAADGHVIHEHQPCQDGVAPAEGAHHDDWASQVDRLLTEIADCDGTAGWPEVCRVITWDCDLRAVPMNSTAAEQVCVYRHQDHETW